MDIRQGGGKPLCGHYQVQSSKGCRDIYKSKYSILVTEVPSKVSYLYSGQLSGEVLT